jgi:predicted short-subunit dehydrogenase-like oxidoreductase (DUF2520 family)
VGCGRVGRTLGRLWREAGTFEIGRVVNRSLASARAAADFIGAGEAATAPGPGADVLLIAAPDAQIETCAEQIARHGAHAADAIAFHCSGTLGSQVLAPLAEAGVRIASVHPVRSFADPARASADFAGTACAIEGDPVACARLRPAFEAIGAELFEIDPEQKRVYHAGAVLACNYLVGLFDVAQSAYARAGLDSEAARRILLPLMRGTLDNLERSDPAAALTGPIARGETEVVAGHLEALDAWRPDVAELYRALGRRTLALSRTQASADPARLDILATLLED